MPKLSTPAQVAARLAAQRPVKVQRATAELLARIAKELDAFERSPSDTTPNDDLRLEFNLEEDERSAETVQAVSDALTQAGWTVEMMSEETMCVWSQESE